MRASAMRLLLEGLNDKVNPRTRQRFSRIGDSLRHQLAIMALFSGNMEEQEHDHEHDHDHAHEEVDG